MKQRILVCDDSPLIRKMLSEIIGAEADLEIVGMAHDGEEAVKLALELKPDVITMDVEMPRKSGLAALQEIMKARPTPIIMVSSITTKGAEATLTALEHGAYDFVAKPSGGSTLHFRQVQEELLGKIRAALSARVGLRPAIALKAGMPTQKTDKVVLIASSTGGPKALQTLWQSLPQGFNAPILIVQHMPAGFTASLAARLHRLGTVPCREAKAGDKVMPGVALIAPGGVHMKVDKNGSIIFEDTPTIHGVKPAADHLFMSAIQTFGARCVGVVLTGMGRDGAAGAKAIREAGGLCYGESQATCTIYGMPKAAYEVGGIDAEFGIHEMGSAIVASLSGRKARAS
ncbi:MAG: chemotaxis response regulator protein-glutamate methylesterase [Fimbriimonadaceae bacterium]|nr:chemotaxis response regulator protein-glutamate methylesterase [Fimbriimonadaceae bacterium]